MQVYQTRVREVEAVQFTGQFNDVFTPQEEKGRASRCGSCPAPSQNHALVLNFEKGKQVVRFVCPGDWALFNDDGIQIVNNERFARDYDLGQSNGEADSEENEDNSNDGQDRVDDAEATGNSNDSDSEQQPAGADQTDDASAENGNAVGAESS